ncbi:hypothetical protein PCO31110_01592 [Pandoraea communis]|uniref:Cyanophage baseplate Pam3 plug gp18 domain-containing protein n=1 Tax=Pandoraea communis TaxID=2508297 RepID=A0A5E4TX28_9BURK|nr:hypothetical protein [Pandoraea communis]VVD90469.1 hypothetical protein PCO31110_01592 [Pandoraea communis]
MRTVPLQALASQAITIILGGQNCRIKVDQKRTGMFFSLWINNVALVTSVQARDRTLLVRQPYLGFVGDLSFFDTQGTDDPEYQGLGTRWFLNYIEAADK